MTSNRNNNVAIVQDGFVREDPLSTLKVVTTLPIPKAGAGEVVVHITMRPINPMDFIFLRGSAVNILPGSGVNNGTPGAEGFGTVYEVGEGVTKLEKGQRVVPHTSMGSMEGKGSWQHYICLAEDLVWPVPDAMTDEQAAQFVINPWAAYCMLKQFLPVPKGEHIIVTAAGSAIARQLISLAYHWDIQLINIVRRPQQKHEIKALGPQHEVICSSDEDVVARVKEITGGRGAWLALDAVGGAGMQSLGASVQDGGRIVVYGALAGFEKPCAVSVMDLLRGVTVSGFSGWGVVRDSKLRAACAAEVAPLVIDGALAIAQDVEKFDLTDFKQAMLRAEQPGLTRKVYLVNA